MSPAAPLPCTPRAAAGARRPLARVACWAALALLVAAPAAQAHGGEDHAHADTPAPTPAAAAAPAAGGLDLSAPQRLPDGRLWVPKPVQHRLGLRTVVLQEGRHAVALELHGRVLPDPQASGQVQASQAGRIEAGPQGLPRVGQRVQQGQVLAWLRPVAGAFERGNQQASLAELDGQLAAAEARAQRLAQLEGAVAQKDIDAARTERDSLRLRRQAVATSLAAPEALRAPVSGVLATSHVGLGQVVDAKDPLFEVVDPQRWLVEALLTDPTLARELGDATAQVGPAAAPGAAPAPASHGPAGAAATPTATPPSPPPANGTLALQWLGASAQLREQSLPVLFKVRNPQVPLAAGQAVLVFARTRQSQTGLALPRAALVRSRAGEPAVWVHQSPEHFVQRVVRWQPLDAAQVRVTDGLHPGDRVVHQGASLLAQIR